MVNDGGGSEAQHRPGLSQKISVFHGFSQSFHSRFNNNKGDGQMFFPQWPLKVVQSKEPMGCASARSDWLYWTTAHCSTDPLTQKSKTISGHALDGQLH